MSSICSDFLTPSKMSSDDLLGLSGMSPTTPSPTISISTSNNSSTRRPPRKSTLTQQQKNQKRQRATQDQLNLLEVEFNKNPTPTASVREKIAVEINMTERSVQIWFQNRYVLGGLLSLNGNVNPRNRRAKIKNLAKRSIETGEECDAIPESMRKYLAMQALESGGKPFGREFAQFGGMTGFGDGLFMDTPASEFAEDVILAHAEQELIKFSNYPPHMQVSQHWFMEACRSERHGSSRLLLPYQVLHHILHQCRVLWFQNRIPFFLHQEHYS